MYSLLTLAASVISLVNLSLSIPPTHLSTTPSSDTKLEFDVLTAFNKV